MGLLCNEEEIESPEWHKDILQERKKKIKKGETEYSLKIWSGFIFKRHPSITMKARSFF